MPTTVEARLNKTVIFLQEVLKTPISQATSAIIRACSILKYYANTITYKGRQQKLTQKK